MLEEMPPLNEGRRRRRRDVFNGAEWPTDVYDLNVADADAAAALVSGAAMTISASVRKSRFTNIYTGTCS